MTTTRAQTVRVFGPGDNRARAHTALGNILRFCKRKPVAAFGGLVVIVLLILALIGPTVAPSGYDEIQPRDRYQGPSASHWFGTDDRGRDVFSRVLHGARVTVVVGFSATLLAAVLAATIGITSGYFGGLFDTVVQRLVEIWQAFPGLIFIIFVISIFGASAVTVILTIGLLLSAGTSRVLRSAALTIKQLTYVEAATTLGAGHVRILLQHVLPNVFPVIIITASLQIGAVILLESSLSFLGFGIPPPYPSWGRMLQESQRFMRQYPYLALFPGAAIALVVYSFNMLGDGLRDVLDPRQRGSR